MKLEYNVRRDVTKEPLFLECKDISLDIKSFITADGTSYPAQKKGDGVLIIANAKKQQGLSGELSCKPADDGVRIIHNEEAKALDIYIEGKIFTSYVYNPSFLKPFLGPIFTRTGDSYTRLDLETTEHPHQRSVFIAVGDVNGIDFWNEYANQPDKLSIRGEERHQSIENIIFGSAYGSFTANNIWYDYEKNPMLDETRNYTFYNQSAECRYVDIEVTFKAAYKDIVFGDTKEAGPLGIRINEEMRADKTGYFTNSYGAVNEEECWGRAASWCDYRGTINGNTYGIAVFDNEDNERYPTSWHIRNYGLFAANNLYFKGNVTIKQGESLTYKFRLCFYENEANIADRFIVYAK